MKSFTFILSTLLSTLSLPTGAAPVAELETRQSNTYTVYYWVDSYFRGAANAQTGVINQCMGFGGAGNTNTAVNWNDKISSAQVPAGVRCYWFRDGGCTNQPLFNSTGPENIYDFVDHNANDVVSSFLCTTFPS